LRKEGRKESRPTERKFNTYQLLPKGEETPGKEKLPYRLIGKEGKNQKRKADVLIPKKKDKI